jgi:hypothetical protein
VGYQREEATALAARMGEESDASVRRGLSESIYNILDENVGQLAAWQRTIFLADRNHQASYHA